MESVEKFLAQASDFVWGPPLLILLFGTHLYLTFRLRFIQRYTGLGIKLSFSREREGEGDISHFGALTTALAATIGTGNIVGVATAIAAGGPGAVLWIWLTGVFGMASKYAEAVLALLYRTRSADGTMAGGPMYVLERGMGLKWLGVVFAAFTAIAAFGIGNMVQANSVAVLAHDTFGVSPSLTGVVLTVLPAVVFLGAGVREAMRYGIARGLFSNEAGLGSAPIVAAAAQTTSPVRQALVSATGVFWDTVIMCALTGLVIVNSGAWMQPGLNGASLSRAAFADIPVIGPIVLTVGLVTFVFATILGWAYYGEKAAEYLFGTGAVRPYRVLWVIAVMIGSVVSLPAVWSFADIANGMMAIPNLVCLLAMTGVVVAETRSYFSGSPAPPVPAPAKKDRSAIGEY